MELAPEARMDFLAGACGGDETLRREVESLLPARELADNFIVGKVADIVAESVFLLAVLPGLARRWQSELK